MVFTSPNSVVLCLLIVPVFWTNVFGHEGNGIEIPLYSNDRAYLNGEILIDRDGFAWYPIQNGIIKKMGKWEMFIPIEFGPGRATPVTALFEDLQGNIWVGCEKGGFKIDQSTFEVEHIGWKTPIDGLQAWFTSFVQQKDSTIWIGTETGHVLKYKNGQIVQSYTSPKIGSGSNAIKLTMSGNSLLARNSNKNQLFHLESDSLKFIGPLAKNSVLIPHYQAPSIFRNLKKRRSFLKNTPYEYRYIEDIQTWELILGETEKWFFLKNTIVAKVNGSMAIKSFSLKDDEIVIEEKPLPTIESGVREFTVDSMGTLWLGYMNKLVKLKMKGNYLTHYLDDWTERVSTRGMAVDSKGHLYVGSYSGTFRIDMENNISELFLNHNFYTLQLENDSILWGVKTDKLYRVNTITGAHKVYKAPPGSIVLEQRDADTFWIGTLKGLFLFNKRNKTFEPFNDRFNGVDLTNETIRDVFQSTNGDIWIATDNGAYHYNSRSGKAIHYKNGGEKYTIPYKMVYDIHEDKSNNIWMATDAGLCQFFIGGPVECYSMGDGLSDARVCGILETSDGLWASTFNGLNKIDFESCSIERINVSTTKTDNEFNHRSALKLNDSTLVFGGTNGIYKMDTQLVENENCLVHIFPVSIKTYDKKTDGIREDFVNGKTPVVTIDHDNNHFEIKFALNNYFDHGHNSFQYLIEGLDDSWQDLGNDARLRLYGLPPGDHKLRIMGINDLGIPSENEVIVPITVNQVFYKTTWFLLLLAISVSGGILIMVERRHKVIKKELWLKQQVKKMEMRALRSQMNPHFIFSTINDLQSDIILKNEETVNGYIHSFSKLLRITMDMVAVEKISLKRELEYLEAYVKLQKYKLKKNLEYRFSVHLRGHDSKEIKIPCMLFQPLVENAIVHGLMGKKDNRRLKIDFEVFESYLIGTVEDNGIGREASKKCERDQRYDQHALGIIDKRIKMTNEIGQGGNIDLQIIDLKKDGAPCGTKVVLKIVFGEAK